MKRINADHEKVERPRLTGKNNGELDGGVLLSVANAPGDLQAMPGRHLQRT